MEATRRLFDERGVQDAPIEQIAQSVGIPRGLIYRQFASKDELFVLTVTDYLAELDDVLRANRSFYEAFEAQDFDCTGEPVLTTTAVVADGGRNGTSFVLVG